MYRRLTSLMLISAGILVATAAARADAPRGSIADVLASRKPVAELMAVQPAEQLKLIEAPLADLDAIQAEDAQRDAEGLPPRFAAPQPVWITPDRDGNWEQPRKDLDLWRLRIGSPGALSLNLGFADMHLPKDARLFIYDAKSAARIRPFTYTDVSADGALWTPVLLTDEVIVEVAVARDARHELSFTLTSINPGYRFFGETGGTRSGSCNVDVVCPEGDAWREEIPAVGVYTVNGTWTCTGAMVNNTSYDQTPYFLTANHCSVNSGNSSGVVIYWNFENSTCRPVGSGASGGSGDGSLSEFTTGSTWRASSSASDFTLIELNSAPDPAWEISFAGWDATGANATSAVAIHHPNTDEKRISFENDPTVTSSYLGTSSPGDGTHVRIVDWDLGTTEPGSSGSPLFNQDHHIIGQLHGGGAACGNNESDYYGRLSVSWTGGGTASSRLSNWLDPGNTGALAVDTISGAALAVSPAAEVLHFGAEGGPFTNPSVVYTLTNPTSSPISYQVSLTVSFGLLLDGAKIPVSGTLPAFGGSTTVTVSAGADLDTLAAGVYSEDVVFDDLTNGKSTVVTHIVEVGQTSVSVTPQTDMFAGGPVGGPFTATMDYTVTSERPTAVAVQVAADQPWISLNGGAGPLTLNLAGTGDADVVTASIAPSAAALSPGVYHGTITFTNLAGGGGNTTRAVALEVGSIVHPATDVPLAIADNSTTISTITVPEMFCIADLNVSVDIAHTYIGDLEVDLTSPSGTTVRLHDHTGGETDNIVTTYDEQGGTIPDGPGTLSDFYGELTAGVWTLRVYDDANQDTGTLNGWSLKMAVAEECNPPQLVHSFPLDANPGWATQGQWAFGQPTGNGGEHGDPDPTSGHTGALVYGYNLNGDYPNSMSAVQYLTSSPIDCSAMTNTKLKFWRWLGVESSTYDHANIQVSNNGSSWTTVWEHSGSAINDGAWVQQSFDISAVADGQSAVRVRWGMGTTDSSYTYCGWNIDDVEFWGILPLQPHWDDCMTGPDLGPYDSACSGFDRDFDGDVDLRDFAEAQKGPAR
ncbi:MAG TPA: proprotein convertase P-domain-containing protein [Phycisphaerae bacterium]|nr:proprotein convertase P-domain-containing protein [Phycisphaerae bacterium]